MVDTHPNANVAVATGAASGVFVLDVDGPEGERFSPSRRRSFLVMAPALRRAPGARVRRGMRQGCGAGRRLAPRAERWQKPLCVKVLNLFLPHAQESGDFRPADQQLAGIFTVTSVFN